MGDYKDMTKRDDEYNEENQQLTFRQTASCNHIIVGLNQELKDRSILVQSCLFNTAACATITNAATFHESRNLHGYDLVEDFVIVCMWMLVRLRP